MTAERDPRFYRRFRETPSSPAVLVRYEVEIQRWTVYDEREGTAQRWYGYKCWMCAFRGRPWTVRAGAVADATRHALNCATIQERTEPGSVLVRVVDEEGKAIRLGPPFSSDSICVLDGLAKDFEAEEAK